MVVDMQKGNLSILLPEYEKHLQGKSFIAKVGMESLLKLVGNCSSELFSGWLVVASLLIFHVN